MRTVFLLSASLVAAAGWAGQAPNPPHNFKKIQITEHFWSEGADAGDFNRDGHWDVASGPFWYEGPAFKVRHEYRSAAKTSKIKQADGSEVTIPGYKGALGNENDYSDNFFTWCYDVNGDGWSDILVVGLPGTPLFYYENPKGQKDAAGREWWPQYKVVDVVDNESPVFADFIGDGKPEVICNANGYLGYITLNWSEPHQPGQFHPISPKGKWHKYTHGIGFGDINGDGRMDLLEQNGWWEQPASLAGDPEWKLHPWPFAPGPGAAQMYGYDFNGDGLTDVLTCLNPHGYGLAWYEQYRVDGQIKFKQHIFMNRDPKDSPYGVKFSQPHAIELVDMDGDGLKDILTGKRFWAHGPKGDDEPNAPAVLYWFKTVRQSDHSVDFVPFLIDEQSGVGTQVVARDLNGDRRPDVVVGNKRGTFVFLSQPGK